MKCITFNELREIKDKLPDGSMQLIADKTGLPVETVRNYFGGHNYIDGTSCGHNIQQGGIGGGFIELGDTKILDMALEIIRKSEKE